MKKARWVTCLLICCVSLPLLTFLQLAPSPDFNRKALEYISNPADTLEKQLPYDQPAPFSKSNVATEALHFN